ncbi:MAG: cytidylate kinase family protein [Spirochaetes bacterium]|nr:cytidylate kinase family protein [Spirochaetota bacterium]
MKNSGIKIAVSGKSGCGNTSVSKLVAQTLGLDFINYTFRSMAAERGMELNELLELAAKDDSWDKALDAHQIKLARDSAGCIIGSRLAVWMLEEADLKVYLYASPEVRAGRILKREGGDVQEQAAITAERDRQDYGRYLRIYNIDVDKYEFVDLLIDTGKMSIQEIADLIIEKAREKTAGKK